ncbi:hypothetical protein [Spirulina sp. 06S082]|uniref:hypothetical protein n=1 Tax=Spirulina sp. 06S082 TaxID=3110248 RepID=UPI002B200ED4|nr:hypothetical protein [Spirulina sp. 06S082]MEA5468825.1 hypothetical protein [Spirulina sp. 06S082]
MTQTPQQDSKNSKGQILADFQQLLAQRQAIASKVATKEEEAEKDKNKELLEIAATYTVDSIVNGMAALQLDFSSIVTNLAERLTNEATKLDELKKAIAVEKDNLDRLKKVRIVADSLYILRQEHQEKLNILEADTRSQQEKLEKEMTQMRKVWTKEQAAFAVKMEEQELRLSKEKEEESGDYRYEIERARQMEMDEYEEKKRLQERTLQEENQDREKDWAEREKILIDNQAEFAENQTKIAGFEDALKAAFTEAKNKAIADCDRDAKVKANLVAKEWEAEKQGYELRIAALNTSIQRQVEQMSELTTQLQAATNQAQSLAMQAFQRSDA